MTTVLQRTFFGCWGRHRHYRTSHATAVLIQRSISSKTFARADHSYNPPLRLKDQNSKLVLKAFSAEHDSEEEKDRRLEKLTDAIILSFFACKAQSLFALSCFVQTVAGMYTDGRTLANLQVRLAVKPIECGASVVTNTDQDIILSWTALIMLTLYLTDVPHRKSTRLTEIVGDYGTEMTQFVEQILLMYRKGVTVEELLSTQTGAAEGMNPALKIMQLNSMLVMLTATAAQGIREGAVAETDARRFVASFDGSYDEHRAAIRAFVAFMGSTRSSVFCIDRFVSTVSEAYDNGTTAKGIVASITETEYEEACRLLPVLDAETPGVGGGISRQLFGRWVSIVFITLAQNGLIHKLSSTESGWAWAFKTETDEQVSEMTNLADFVSHSLTNIIADDSETSIDLSDRLTSVPGILQYLSKYKEEAQKEKAEKYGTSWTAIEDEEMQYTSPSVLAFWQMIFLVHLTYRKLMAALEIQNM